MHWKMHVITFITQSKLTRCFLQHPSPMSIIDGWVEFGISLWGALHCPVIRLILLDLSIYFPLNSSFLQHPSPMSIVDGWVEFSISLWEAPCCPVIRLIPLNLSIYFPLYSKTFSSGLVQALAEFAPLGICFLGWYNKLLRSSLPWVLPALLSYTLSIVYFFGITHQQRFERNFWIMHEVCWPGTAFTWGLLAWDSVSHPPSWRTLIPWHQMSVFSSLHISKGSNRISGLCTRSAGPGLHSPEVFWPGTVPHIHLPGGLSFPGTRCPFFQLYTSAKVRMEFLDYARGLLAWDCIHLRSSGLGRCLTSTFLKDSHSLSLVVHFFVVMHQQRFRRNF